MSENVVPIRGSENDEQDQAELFPGWKVKSTHFTLTSARGLPLGEDLHEGQHVKGSWSGTVVSAKVGKDRVVYDIQVIDAEVSG